MYSILHDDEKIRFSISSHLSAVDRLVEECRLFAARHSDRATSSLELVLREMLLNAVEHGNGNDPTKRIDGYVQLIGAHRFTLTVHDEGGGIPLDGLHRDRMVLPTDDRNRGLAIIHAFADDIELGEGGNSITAYIGLHRETEYEVQTGPDRVTITPSDNLTASGCDRLRELLKEISAQDPGTVVFDLYHVEHIDSVSLSVLIAFSRDFAARGGTCSMLNVARDIELVIRLMRLNEVFDLEPCKSAGD